ncbi:MAG: iron-containing alcohol dehydrogenase [Bacteroidota bacterium]
MENFNFYNPTKIFFGKNRLGELDTLVPKNANVLILYGGGSVKKYGTLDIVVDALVGRNIIEFGGIEPNPKYETLIKAVEIVVHQNIDFLLAVGGGSVIDGTKFVNLASNYQGDNPSDLLTKPATQGSVKTSIATGTIITLPATGSEMNSGGVITYNHGKHVISSPLLYPQFSIIDPTLSYTLPVSQIANGIVDSFIHVIEQYVTYPAEGRFQDRTAEGILQTLIEIGKQTIDNPTDYDSRANLSWCSTMALNGLIGCGVPGDWSTHMIGHELTAMFGIDHGKTLAILQPSIWEIRKDKKREKLIQYAERVWHITDGDGDYKIEQAIKKTRDFFESLGVKTRMSDYGITEDKIDDLVEALEKHGLTALSETKDLTLDISREILENAM